MSSSSLFDFADHGVAVPQHLEAELELGLHLVDARRRTRVRRLQKRRHVVAGLEHRAERHRQHGVFSHDRFVDPLMRQHVVARRIEHAQRRVRHDRGQIVAAHRIDRRRFLADADGAEGQRLVRADDAIDVAALAGAGSAAPCARLGTARTGPTRGWRRRRLASDPTASGDGRLARSRADALRRIVRAAAAARAVFAVTGGFGALARRACGLCRLLRAFALFFAPRACRSSMSATPFVAGALTSCRYCARAHAHANRDRHDEGRRPRRARSAR